VTLGYFFYTSSRDVAYLTEKEIAANAALIASSKYPMIQSSKNTNEYAFIEAYSAQANLKPLSKAAENCGYFNADPDSDGVIRWAPLVIRFQDNYYSSLPISMLTQYLDWPTLTLKIRRKRC